MNLKVAARRLGVHYQTAYRWVRSGELIAVRTGGSYEISEAALTFFLHQRANLADDRVTPMPSGQSPVLPCAIDKDPLLAQLCDEAGISLQPLLDHVTSRLAEEIGDGCVLRLGCGDSLTARSARHVDPSVQALLTSILTSGEGLPAGAHELIAARQGRTVCENFVRQDRQEPRLPRVYQQHASRLAHFGHLSVAVRLDDGLTIGVLSLTRSAPGRPYTSADEAAVMAYARWVAAGWQRHEQFQLGYQACTRVVALLEQPGTTNRERHRVAGVLRGLTSVGCAVFDATRHPVVANVPIEQIPAVAHPAASAAWEQIDGLGLDYLHDEITMCEDDSSANLEWHWAVCRRPDFSVDHVVVTWTTAEQHRQLALAE